MNNASTWSSMCRRSQGHALNMSQCCSADFAILVRKETQEFCELSLPETEAELTLRRKQENALRTKIYTICHGHNMSATHPNIIPQVLEEVRKCCGLQTTDDDFETFNQTNFAVHSAIRNLCFSDLTQQTKSQM